MKVLIPAYTGLGNFILKTPFINSLKTLYPNIKIDVVFGLPFGAEKVLHNSDLINETFWLPINSSFQKKIGFFRFFSKRSYDYVFFPFDSCPPFFLYLSFFFSKRK